MIKSIITIARMNPPTIGHLKLIENMMEYALSNNEQKIFLILSSTKDKKNPLECNRKRELLLQKGMVDHVKKNNPKLKDIEVIIFCMKDDVVSECGTHSILKHICNIIKLDSPSEFELFIGEDRASSYSFVNTYLEKQTPPISINTHVLSRTEINSTQSVNKTMVTPDNISASFMRKLVTDNNKSLFLSIVEQSGLTKKDGEELYEELHRELTPKPKSVKPAKSSTKAKPAKSSTKAKPAKSSTKAKSEKSSTKAKPDKSSTKAKSSTKGKTSQKRVKTRVSSNNRTSNTLQTPNHSFRGNV